MPEVLLGHVSNAQAGCDLAPPRVTELQAYPRGLDKRCHLLCLCAWSSTQVEVRRGVAHGAVYGWGRRRHCHGPLRLCCWTTRGIAQVATHVGTRIAGTRVPAVTPTSMGLGWSQEHEDQSRHAEHDLFSHP